MAPRWPVGVLVAMTIALAGIRTAVAAEPVRIVCLGDSVTKAVREGVRPEETFCTQLERMLSTPTRPVEVINAGVGDNTTADGLARLDRDVLAHRPDYAVLMFGLNDSWIDAGKTESRLTVAEYRANLQVIITTIRKHGATVILMTPNPAIAPKYPSERNRTLKPYVDAVRALAANERCELVDVYARFGEMAIEGVELNTLFTDAMHPNPAGQRMIAEMLAAKLGPLFSPGRP